MRTFLGEVPLSAFALAVTFVGVIALSRPVADRLPARRAVGALLVFGFGLVISATLVPTAAALEGRFSDGVCDLSRIGLAPLRELTSVSFSSLNVLLFVPLGIAVGLLPRTPAAAAVALAAVSLTFVVETIQLLLPVLGRGCQAADMADNLLGLAIGAALGLVLRRLPRAA